MKWSKENTKESAKKEIYLWEDLNKVAEMPTDQLAHALDIDFRAAKIIQNLIKNNM